METIVVDLFEPRSNCRRCDDRVKHLWPPGPSLRPFGGARIHDRDVAEVLVMVIVVSNVETWRAFRQVPDVVIDLSICSFPQLHADATDRDVVVDLVVRSPVI